MKRISHEQYMSLSKTNRTIYDYILENYPEVSFLTIHELSNKIGVSAASLTRFAKAMGFSGYISLVKEIQNDVKDEIRPMKGIKISIGLAKNDKDLLQTTINQNIKDLESVYNDGLAVNFTKAIEIIRSSRHIYVLGMRSSYSMAYYFFFMLSQFMDNVFLVDTGEGSVYDIISRASKEDAVFSIGFRRYTKSTVQITQYFHSLQSQVITLTDSTMSPLVSYASSSLIVPNNSAYSFSPAITVLNALVVGIGARDKEATLEKMRQREEIVLANEIYL